jgi:membrane protein YqaA with SNARE-associated domain
MESVDWLISLGMAGMFLSAFLAGTVFPFNSEIVLAALLPTGLDVFWLVVVAAAGNSLGGATTYYIGRQANGLGSSFSKHPKRLERASELVGRYGVWLALLSWLPVWGNLFLVALGFFGARSWLVLSLMTLGKTLRYVVLAAVVLNMV